MTLQWISTNLRTGFVIADLPTFEPDWPLRRTLSQYETATGTLHLDGAPPNWEAAVLEGATLLACYDDADPAQTIQWAGYVSLQTRNTGDDAVDLSLATTEGYFDRRFVGDKQYTDEGQDLIADDLVQTYAADGALPGIPITTVYATAGGGTLRSQIFQNTDNSTLYARLSQLAALTGGIEWMVDWVWNEDHTGLEAQFIVGSRIGASADGSPQATFDMPGPVISAEQNRSYEDGKGANDVRSYSTGQGASTPFSMPARASNFADRPTFEYRYQPQASVTSQANLQQYATQALKILAPGQQSLTLTAALTDVTRHGNLWHLGDDIGYAIGGLDQNGRDTVRCFPGGIAGVGRAIAYELTESADDGLTIAPILAVADIEGQGNA